MTDHQAAAFYKEKIPQIIEFIAKFTINIMKIICIHTIGLIIVNFTKLVKLDYAIKHDNEEVHLLQESIKLFGPPRPLNYENLPGPELALDEEKSILKNVFISDDDDSGNYTLKFRAITEHFSYNDHYEVGETTTNGSETIFTVKGQFTEKIPRKEGGYFLRTVGYVSDRKGYRLFLVDVSRVTTSVTKRIGGGGYNCGRRRRRSPIPPCAIASLAGGGLG